ncbi:hypothetical protein Godav_022288 [Gossypium davidsonii]|uniref:Plastid lipid-associated protein/fibrillin conserved domain-containing protein n=1 Tax=Gossypium davidsonii TaxID=34287 RepID=A0A7J8T946_GOSDV|nr:hypothetical protein [Gossypium davidsonii]
MALLLTAQPSSLLLSKSLKVKSFFSQSPKPTSLSFPFSSKPHKPLSFSSFISLSSSLSDPTPESDSDPETPTQINITDEWGERSELGSDPEPTKLPDSDPPRNEDEWEEQVADLKRCLVDSVYGTELGFRAGQELRAEILELVNQLEAVNPTRAPIEATQLLDGNWILLYTAFSELLPLLAAGATPLLKVKSISQSIDTASQSIVNSTTLSGPFADLSFSASATFEVRSPSRIQVEFKEGIVQPPEIKPSVDLPADIDVFGQRISLSPVQQSLGPLQDLVANISRTISGQPPLKIPIPGNRSSSWLLITYLDEDLRISRGDGGLFVLARQGSPLLEQ